MKPVIFIVDDDEGVRDSLDAYLTLKGMTVSVFESAQHVLAHTERNPDLLILDVNMPGIDGFALFELLRDRGQHSPVIFISGLGDDEMRSRAAQLGASTFIDKPVDPVRLLACLGELLSWHPPHAG